MLDLLSASRGNSVGNSRSGAGSSSRSQTQSNSSQDSVENTESTGVKKPPESLEGTIMKNRKRPMKGWHEVHLFCESLLFKDPSKK